MTKGTLGLMTKFLHFYQSHRSFRFLMLLLISIIFGLFWFLFLYGRYPLYFTNVNWIYKAGGDIFQHQIGWEWFRQEPWHFPLGRIDAYGYPFGTSITYNDSIPLMALLFKLLSSLFTQNIQYLGLWELISVIGQLFFGVLILGEFTPSFFKKILGASMLVLAPPLIFRAFSHDSLTAQWILLAAIWFIILEYRHRLWRGAWVILFAVATLIHLYFVAMLVPLWAISLFFHYKSKKNKWTLIVDVLTVAVVILFIGYCIDIFSLQSKDLEAPGFGIFSWNLNGFINPLRYSAIFKQMSTGTTGQYEGFSYLGLGNFLILPVALILFFWKDYSPQRLYFLLPFVLVSILFGLFALSSKAFVNTQPLWNIQLPGSILKLCSMFQSSGRFIWPVFYFLVLFGLISLIRNFRYATPLILLALVLQLIDIQPLYSSKKSSGFEDYHSGMQAEFWQAAAKTNQHIILIPALNAYSFYEPTALYARENQLTLNWGYFSRAEYVDIENYANRVWEGLKIGKTDQQTIYIFWGSDWEGLAKKELSKSMLICQVDGYEVVLSKNNDLAQTNFDLQQYCSFP
jgi:hypothetical protein